MGTQMRAGVAAFKTAKREQEAKRGTSSYGTFRFKLEDGEEAPCRFAGVFRALLSDDVIDQLDTDVAQKALALFGGFRRTVDGKKESTKVALKRRMTEAEPIINAVHVVAQGGNKFTDFTCTEEDPAFHGKPCVGCYCVKKRDKKVGFVKNVNGFTLFDERMQHKVERGDKEGNEYPVCTMEEKGKCKWCSRASEKGPVHPAKYVGRRKLSASKQFATQIITLQERLSKKCISCNKGKIRIDNFCCGNPECGEILPDMDDLPPSVRVRCAECSKKSVPVPEYGCTSCEEPVPGSLMDYPCMISRSGSGKETTYVVTVRDGSGPEPLPKEAREAGAINWLQECKPVSTAEQAQKCMLKSDPFSGKGTGASDYDDDEDDEEDDEDDEPKGKKSKKSKRMEDDDDE